MIKSIKVNFSQLLFILISFTLFCFITACGGSQDGGTSGGTTDTGRQITSFAGSPTSLSAGQSSILTVKVTNTSGTAVSGAAVNFAFVTNQSGGTVVELNGGITDAGGKAVAVYTAGATTESLKLDDTIQATCGSATEALILTRTAGTSATEFQMTLSADVTSLTAGQSSIITAIVTTSSGTPAAGRIVTFAKLIDQSTMTLAALNATTDASGKAVAVYTAGNTNETADVQDTVSATVSGSASSGAVVITRAGTASSSTVTPGYIMTVKASVTSLTAGQSSIITATVTDSSNKVVGGLPVNFTFVTNNSSAPALDPASGTTDASGSVSIIYIAGSGSLTSSVQDIISAGVTSGGYSSSGAVVITRTVTPDTSTGFKMTFTANPSSLASGQNSILTAIVTNGSGVAVKDLIVNIDFITNNSGAPALSAVSGTTDASGRFSTVYTAGSDSSGASVQDTFSASVTDGTYSAAEAVIITRTGGPSGLQMSSFMGSPMALGAGRSSILTVKVTDSTGVALSGKTVDFAFVANNSGGTMPMSVGTTDASGQAVGVYTAGPIPFAMSIEDTISATCEGTTRVLIITRTAGSPLSLSVNLSASVTSLTAGQSSIITALVTNSSGAPVAGETVTFDKVIDQSTMTLAAIGGGLTATTDASGQAVAVYTAGNTNETADVQDTVSASVDSGAFYGAVIIARAGTASSSTVTPGYIMTVKASVTSLTAGQSSIITATVTDSSNNVAGGLPVTFTFVPTPSSIGSTLSATSGTTDASGSVSIIYTAGAGSPGSVQDVVQANVTVLPYSSSGAVVITRTETPATSAGFRMTFAADPSSLATGQYSILTATVTDGFGAPVNAQNVTISFITNNSGAPALSPVSGTTDASGRFSTVYTAGSSFTGTSVQDTLSASVTDGVYSAAEAIIITVTASTAATTATSLDLSASPPSIKTDGSTTSTITVNALNSGNAALSGVVVILSTDTGVLSAPSVTTPGTVILSCGGNKDNRTATVTANAGTAIAQIPVQIVGSTVTIESSGSTIPNDGSTVTLTVTAKDAGGFTVPAGTPVTLTQSGVGSVGFGAGLTTTISGVTNGSGQFITTATGVTNGLVTITAAALGTTGTTPLTVTASGAAFGIENQYLDGSLTPITGNPDPTAMSINPSGTPYTPHSLKIVVNAPGVTTVRFATTIGGWNSSTNKVVDVAVGTTGEGAGKVSAILTSTNIGVANVQVSDTAAPATNDTLAVAMASGAAPAKIILQAAPTVVPVSVGSTTGSSTLIATVYDALNYPLVNQPVAFEIVDGTSTSGGETITPVVVMTAATAGGGLTVGQARATFNSGSMPSGGAGVQIRASVVGTTVETEPIGVNLTASGEDVAIVIGGTAGSIAFGQDSKASQDSTGANYLYKMSVLVADSNGNPVSGAVVNLGVWPIAWATGVACTPDTDGLVWDPSAGGGLGAYVAGNGGTFWNEDANENLILDAGEDGNRIYYYGTLPPSVTPGTLNGLITPVNSAGGTVPASVTTDENGVAGFTVTYPKTSGMWIYDRIRATTMVQGSETRAEIIVYLRIVVGEEVICSESPFNF